MAKPKKKDIKRSILVRVRMLYTLFFFIGMAIAGKILYIQYGPKGAELRGKGDKITYERVTVEAARGDILSWDGRILATSIPMYEVRMDFAANGLKDSIFLHNVDSLAWYLADFFRNQPQSAYKAKLLAAFDNKSKNRYTLISPRRVNHLEIKEIGNFPIFRLGQNRGGFIPVQINRRILPHGSLASRTIGMVNEADTKLGIEGAYDSILRGVDGNMMMQRISGSFRIPVPDDLSVDPVDGIDVVTTLDVDLQDVAETALRNQLQKGDADWGTAVLMEVATGEIRAITNLTRKSEGVYVEDFNYAIGMNLEPGSTFKLASLMTLLDAGGATMDDIYDTRPGTAMVGPVRVVDTHNCGEIPLSGVFQQSSNIGFAKAVNRHFGDSPDKFVNHLRKMGFDKPLELQIAGEAAPILRGPKDQWWDRTTLTMMSYGYALRLTPLKTLAFYNAVANDGKMMRPMFVKELRQYGHTLQKYNPEVMISSIGSKKVVQTVQEALESVVEQGTAKVLRNPNYKVAGKTGTAQIAQGRSGYTDARGGRHYLATLVGYFPADNPKYSCIVAVKTYHGPGRWGTYYGASLAGPVFRAISDRVYAQHVEWQVPLSKALEKADESPYLKMGHAAEVRRVANTFQIPYKAPERGVQWVNTIEDTTGRHMVPVVPGEGLMPDVTGMGLKEALYILEKEGLVVSFSGVGVVEHQSLKPGAAVRNGTAVTIRLGFPKRT